MQLEVKGGTLKIVIKAGGILDVVEYHPLDGSEVEIKRRDLRRGKTLTRASRTPEGLLCLQYVPRHICPCTEDEFRNKGFTSSNIQVTRLAWFLNES
jgi:hypothetical protein